MSIKVLLEQTKTKLESQVRNLDLYELMILQVLDHADWLVTEYRRICEEEAKKRALGEADYYKLFKQCIYESIGEVDKMLQDYVLEVYNSANTLFNIFYNYSLPDELTQKYFAKADEIVREAIKTYISS